MNFIESILAGKATRAIAIIQDKLKRMTLVALQSERERVACEIFGKLDENPKHEMIDSHRHIR
jgi:hypothetical protein